MCPRLARTAYSLLWVETISGIPMLARFRALIRFRFLILRQNNGLIKPLLEIFPIHGKNFVLRASTQPMLLMKCRNNLSD